MTVLKDALKQGSSGQFTTITVSGLSKLAGAVDGSPVEAGYIGEVEEASLDQASAVALVTGQSVDICNIELTAGNWRISGAVLFTGAATGTQFQGYVGTATGNDPEGRVLFQNTMYAPAPSAASDSGGAVPTYTLRTTDPITLYLKAASIFTVGTPEVYGSIRAERFS